LLSDTRLHHSYMRLLLCDFDIVHRPTVLPT
jgi:hypothetical protein